MQGLTDTAAIYICVGYMHSLDFKRLMVVFLQCVGTPLVAVGGTLDSHPLLIIFYEGKVKIIYII